MEWNSSLYVNIVDYEKAFDSLDRETLWKILRHYEIGQHDQKLMMRECHKMEMAWPYLEKAQ